MIIQAHLGIIVALCVMLGWRDLKAVGKKIWQLPVQLSAQNILMTISHQVHQIASHPFHHLPMGLPLPDDNPSSFGHHCGIGCHAGLEGLASCWQDLALLVQLFSPKPPDDHQPSSTSDCCSSFSSSPNGSTR
jgi:hypothetical protein